MDTALLFSATELDELRKAFESDITNPLLRQKVVKAQEKLRPLLCSPLNIPGQGEAGGSEHAQHKLNYQHLNLASQLWLITSDLSCLEFAKAMLLGYAKVYESLPPHVSKDSNPPGKLFHQCLNESMWLLYAVDAYSNIHSELAKDEAQVIESRLFRPMVDLVAIQNVDDFDVIHNHGIWSVAAVCFAGLVLADDDLVVRSLYGNNKDGKTGGFYAQLDKLFSPDGYYLEGPYYHRFALRPVILLAEALFQSGRDSEIYQYRAGIIGKAIECLQELAFGNGRFVAINDSSKTIGLSDEGAVLGAVTLVGRYDKCELHRAMLDTLMDDVSRLPLLASTRLFLERIQNHAKIPAARDSSYIVDGANGDQGGVAIMRAPTSSNEEAMVYMTFGQHGSDPVLHSALDHGHFDGLHLGFFNGKFESLTDYGFCRWVNVEPKFGGRYTAENKTYAKQTVAHNTMVVDEVSQHALDTQRACDNHGSLVYVDFSNPKCQSISARLIGYYPGVALQRTIFLIDLPGINEPLLVDIQRAESESEHRYDSPLHFQGQIITTKPALQPCESPRPLSTSNGYQHLWKLSQTARIAANHSASITWLQEDTFTSAHVATSNSSEIVYGLTGAKDPDNNLRNEPYLMSRSQGVDHTVATVIETHGYFDEAHEVCHGASASIEAVKILSSSSDNAIIELSLVCGRSFRLSVAFQDAGTHSVEIAGQEHGWNGWFDFIEV